MDARTQKRYEAYDQLKAEDGTACPSCRAQWHWSDEEGAWQAVHRDACRFIAWWRARRTAKQPAKSVLAVAA